MSKLAKYWIWFSLGFPIGLFACVFFFVHEPAHLLVAGGGEWYELLRVRVHGPYTHTLYFAGFTAEVYFALLMMWILARKKVALAGFFQSTMIATYLRAYASYDFAQIRMTGLEIALTWTLICVIPILVSTRMYSKYFVGKETRIYQGIALK